MSVITRERYRRIVRDWQRRFVTITAKNERLLGVLTVTPVIVLFSLTAILPIAWAVAVSFHQVPMFNPKWTFVGAQNYVELFQSPELHYSLYIGIAYAVITTFIELVLGIGIALLIGKRFRGISIVRMIVLSPYLLPTVVVALLFQFMGSQFGVFSDLLIKLGIFERGTPFFTQMPHAFIGVVLASVWKFTLFVVLMTLARLQSIPESYYESAKISGAGPWRRFWDITFPQIKGIVLIVLLLRGVWMFNKFDIIYILTKGGPSGDLRTLVVFAYEKAFIQFHLGIASAVSTIGFVILSVVAIVYFWRFNPSEEVTTR